MRLHWHRPKANTNTRPRSYRPMLELLEDRLAPAAGALDLTFSGDGKVITDFTGPTERATTEHASAVALQSDGKIVVVGATDSGGGGSNFAVARYLADGTLDPDFKGGGKFATDFAGGQDEARGVAIQADGKIVVAGFAQVNGSFEFALARYKPDGFLDTSFGTNGQVKTPGTGFGLAMALQADGKIIVAGGLGSSGDFILARYNPDGKALDAGFGTGGMVTTDFDGNDDAVRSVALQADGKIVATGETAGASGIKFALARYKPDGSLDPDFDVDGKVTTDFGGPDVLGLTDDEPRSVALQPDGKIVVAGSTFRNGDFLGEFTSAFAVARFNTDGSPDFDFDADGKVITDFGSGFDGALSVVIQAAGGRIVVAGGASFDFFSQVALARYNPDGSPDTSFGAGGTVTTDFGVSSEAATMALQADGKIVVAGAANNDLTLARYVGTAPEIAVLFAGADLPTKSTVAYGTTPVGTPVSKTFTIRNLGNLSLTVSSITVPAGYQLTTPTSFPVKLAAGAQTSMSVQLTAGTAGVFSGKVAIASNDSNEDPFVIGVSGTALAPTHEIQVLNGFTDIPDNTGAVNFGTANLGGATVTRTFTVRNIGNTNLTLGPTITVPLGFFLVSGFGSTTLAPAASTTFKLGINTGNLGSFSGQVSFATNDSDENPFNFTVTCAVTLTITAPMIRGESLTRRVDEGGVATLRGHLVDPDPQDELFLSIDWADGTPTETHAVGRAPFAFQHRYVDDKSDTAADDYQVHFTWFDSGGGSNSKSLPVTVGNVAPQVSVGLPVLLGTEETLHRVGTFTDSGLDSWYATVDYGDGRGQQWLPLGPDNNFTLDHRYARPGVYKVQVRIFDDDGGIDAATLLVTVLPDDHPAMANHGLGQVQDFGFADTYDVSPARPQSLRRR